METKSESDNSALLTEEKQVEVDELFQYLVEVHIDIQKNLIALRYNHMGNKQESKLIYRELNLSFINISQSEFLDLCSTCLNKLSTPRNFLCIINHEEHYRKVIHELKEMQDFAIKYMCFLSRSRNFANNNSQSIHFDYIKEKIESSENTKEMYEKLSRKYFNKMKDSEEITAASLADQICILQKSNFFKNVFNVQVLVQMLLYFLAHKVDVPTKSDTTGESANLMVIKMMRDSLEELIDEMKSLRMHQKAYTEDVNAIKEMSIQQKNYIEDIIAKKEMLNKLK